MAHEREGPGDRPVPVVINGSAGDGDVAEHGGTGSGDDAPATLEATLNGDPVSLPGPLFVSAVDRALRIRVPS